MRRGPDRSGRWGAGPAIAPANQRAYALFAVGTAAAFLLHCSIIPLFWVLGARVLAFGNILSLAAYAAAFLANRRGHHLATALIALVELTVHQAACVWYLGWDAGFQYYLLTVIPTVFLLPPGRLVVRIAMVASTPVAFALMQHAARVTPPVLAIDPTTLAVLYDINVTAVFALLALFAWVYAHAAEVAEAGLRAARARAETLLHSILPVPIAERLEAGEQPIADAFDDATILFADLVGFTPLSEKVSPATLVALLDDVFSRFDALVERRGLEKIKTIGDAYMVAGGVPARRADHVEAVAGLALEMLDTLRARAVETGVDLQMRVGVHSGPVVAGVIGRRKFAYDLWGDAVNTAARMESHGLPGTIHVTRAVRDALADRCRFEPRGTVDVKGKGPMETWLLVGWRDDALPVAAVPAAAAQGEAGDDEEGRGDPGPRGRGGGDRGRDVGAGPRGG